MTKICLFYIPTIFSMVFLFLIIFHILFGSVEILPTFASVKI